MFTHLTVGANDVEASRKFYDAVLPVLGIPASQGPDPKGRYWWRTDRGAFAVGKPIDGQPACPANGGTIGFFARDAAAVKAFHDAGVAAGGTSIEDPPGERAGPFGVLNLAYLRDPSGNKICALHRVG
ncbi:VOC family protein [Brevundimonas sp. VNH65]|uniref:VOC family protein n=1 Tax=Brevundimonas sp. VNH65 TaxID=3400917 RepID=UPI003C0A3722